MAGIVWASVDSLKWQTGLGFVWKSSSASVTRDGAYTYFEWGPRRRGVAPGWHFLRNRDAAEEVKWEDARSKWEDARSVTRMLGREVFRIPDKPVIALLLLCWCGWLGWRIEQIRRLAADQKAG